MSKQNGTKPAPAAPAPAPAPAQGQPLSVEQVIAECHARLRRVNGDLVYVGSVIDTLYQELVARDKAVQELRAKVSEMETAMAEEREEVATAEAR